MKIKCPKCGYEFESGVQFCAMCGYKIENSENDDKISAPEDVLSSKEIQELKLNAFSTGNYEKDNKPNFINFARKSVFDSAVFNFVLSLIVISFVMCTIMYLIINKQGMHKLELQYRNLINNPQQIPELVEPRTFDELKITLRPVESFLGLYLKS